MSSRWKQRPTKQQLSLLTSTPLGYERDQVVSALQKEIRRGHEREAVWWALELAEMGDVDGLWRRLCVIAAEDVGTADPEALVQFNISLNLYRTARGAHGEQIIITKAVLELARAKKNREANMLTTITQRMRAEGEVPPVPPYAVDTHTREGRGRFRDEAEAFVWWVEHGQRCERTSGPNLYLEDWVRWYGRKVGLTPEQERRCLAALHEQYPETARPVSRLPRTDR